MHLSLGQVVMGMEGLDQGQEAAATLLFSTPALRHMRPELFLGQSRRFAWAVRFLEGPREGSTENLGSQGQL